MNPNGIGGTTPAQEAGPEGTLFPGVSVRQVVLGTLVALSVAGGFGLILQFAPVFFSLFMAIVLGTSLRPALDWLSRHGLSRRTSAVLVYLAIVALLVGFILLILPLVVSEAAAAAAKAPAFVTALRGHMLASSSATLRRIAADLPLPGPDLSVPHESLTGAQAFAGVHRIGSGVFTAIAVLVLGFYWSLEGELTVRALLLFSSLERRESHRELIEAAEAIVGDYVRGQAVVCLVTGSLSLLAFTLLGLPSALVLGLIAGVMGAVPIFGAPLGAIPAVLMAATEDPSRIPWVVGVALLVHIVQDYIVVPRVMRGSLGVNPFVVLLAISAFGSLLGPAGAILAVPMAALIQLLLDRFVFDRDREEQPMPQQRDRLGVLRLEAKRLALDVRRQSRKLEGTPGDHTEAIADMVESIANHLDRTLAARELAEHAREREIFR